MRRWKTDKTGIKSQSKKNNNAVLVSPAAFFGAEGAAAAGGEAGWVGGVITGGWGTAALPGSVTASGRWGRGGGSIEIPRLLGGESVSSGRGWGVHARWRGADFTHRRRAPARHPGSVHHPDTHAAVGQRRTADQTWGGGGVGGTVRHRVRFWWEGVNFSIIYMTDGDLDVVKNNSILITVIIINVFIVIIMKTYEWHEMVITSVGQNDLVKQNADSAFLCLFIFLNVCTDRILCAF